jgi:uncharacterized protein (DUF433 family)
VSKHFPHPNHPLIFIDPDINFGEPTVEGCGIKAEALWRPWDLGDSIEQVASVFNVPVEAVQAAVEWCVEFPPEEATDAD